jgi:hypothetical protein
MVIEEAVLRHMTGEELLILAALSGNAMQDAIEEELDHRALANPRRVLHVRSRALVARRPADRPVVRVAMAA